MSKFEMKKLDHGVLNVPLSKRGDIDRQIDKYKEEQRKIEKERVELRKAEFKENKEYLEKNYGEESREKLALMLKKRKWVTEEAIRRGYDYRWVFVDRLRYLASKSPKEFIDYYNMQNFKI